MSESCIWKSIITYLKLSKLNPKRVRGIHKNPKIILGREPLQNENVFYYWIELNDKVYSEYGIIDINIWNDKYKDYDREIGNTYGLLPNELEQLSNPLKFMIMTIKNENDFTKKKEGIKLLEQLWS